MAKAKAQITISYIIDIKASYRYYLLQGSTLSKPSKPTTFPPSSSWGDTEPSYTEGSTNSLYFVDCTVFCDDTFIYSEVSLSSSYEAAKQAYNKATNAQNTANNAQDDIDNLEMGTRNLLLNSSFTKDFLEWGNNGAEIVTVDDVTCAYISGELTVTKQVNQSILAKLDLNDLTQTYVFSADVRLDNYVAGTTNPYVKLYFSGNYDNDGTSTWLGATTISGKPECNAYNNQGWVRMSYVVRFDKVPISMHAYVYARDFTGDLYFKNLKLEKGNRATDWTPAPEDMATSEEVEDAQHAADEANKAIDETNTKVAAAEALISQLEDCIAMLVTDENGESLMTQTSTGWTFSMSEVNSTMSGLSSALDTLQQETGNTQSTVDTLQSRVDELENTANYVRIGTYDDEPCIELGKTDSAFKVIITNTQIMFMEGDNKPTHIETDGLVTQNITIESDLKHGNFVWKQRANGNYGLQYIGGSS